MPFTAAKSSSLAQLENNLIVDLEDGSNYISGYIAKATTWQELREIAKELATTEHQFKFVTMKLYSNYYKYN